MANENLTAAEVQGIFGDMKKAIDLIRSPVFKDVLAVIAAVQTPGLDDDKAAISKLLIDAGKPQAAELVGPLFDLITGLIDQFSTVKELLPDSGIRVMAEGPAAAEFKTGERKAIKDMTTAECQKWFDDHKGSIREEAKSWMGHRVLSRRCPEILATLDGTATVAAVTALTPEQIIKGLNTAILILTFASAVYPPLAILVTILKIVLAKYTSDHPDVGLSLVDLLDK